MDKLSELVALCKCGVIVTINEHRNVYETAEEYCDELENLRGAEFPDEETKAKAIELNQVVEIQFYPDTPIGFYLVVHHDVDSALGKAIDIAMRNRVNQ